MSDIYLGIDLGTTNSSACVFDGNQLELVRNSEGTTLTPSQVFISTAGDKEVGHAAKRRLGQEAQEGAVYSEFKRVLGSDLRFERPGEKAGLGTLRPEELSAAILSSLRADVEAQTGLVAERAVVAVPALFELPQIAATVEAARLGGFSQVETIQEPVASALAAGFRPDSPEGVWLVYDLGGGTFDVSLLETRDGLLRVVAHDGDNFAGGRDIDSAIVEYFLQTMGWNQKSADASTRATLRALAEQAKMDLTRKASVRISRDVSVDGSHAHLDVELTRDQLVSLAEPIVGKTLQVVARLLAAQGLTPGQLSRVVLVGGPTVMPFLRRRISEACAAPMAERVDPMTLVAQGAALFAADAKLSMRSAVASPATVVSPAASVQEGVKIWLQYPALTADRTPYLVGKLDAGALSRDIVKLEVRREDGEITEVPVDPQGSVLATLNLRAHQSTGFSLVAVKRDGTRLPTEPKDISVHHGVALGDPPLARTLGLALANNDVQVYFERGAALPQRRTFVHETVEPLSPTSEAVVRLPIVQGELPYAHLCRQVGALVIRGASMRQPLPARSRIELTLSVDRGGQLEAQARIPSTGQVFDDVIQLRQDTFDADSIAKKVEELALRLAAIKQQAFSLQMPSVLRQLTLCDARMSQLHAVTAAVDPDARVMGTKLIHDIDSDLSEIEQQLTWPRLEEEIEHEIQHTVGWVGEWGAAREQEVLDALLKQIQRARQRMDAKELRSKLVTLRRLGANAYLRHPDAWGWEFDAAVARLTSMHDPQKANELMAQGQKALAAKDRAELERIVRQLWKLLPPGERDRRASFDSGVV